MKPEMNKSEDERLNEIESSLSYSNNNESTGKKDSFENMTYEQYINKWGYLGTTIAALIVSSFVIGLGVLWWFQSIGFTNVYSVIISSQLSLLIFAFTLFQFNVKDLMEKLKGKPKISSLVLAFFIAILLVGINYTIFSLTGEQSNESSRTMLSLIIGAVILAPIIEEIGFRVGLKHVLIDKGGWSKYYYILISSLMFSFIHWSPGGFNIFTLIGTGLVGVLLGFLYLRTENTYVVIFAHMTYNIFIILLTYSL